MSAAVWSLVQYVDPGGGARPCLGLLVGGVVHAPPAGLAGLGVMEVVQGWAEHGPLLRSLDVGAVRAGAVVEGAVLVAPLTYPRKVLCAGTNYVDHCAEMGTKPPDPDGQPFFFLKTPTTTIIGPDAIIPLPARQGVALDWEAELAVVIAHRCKDVAVAQARSHVAGYLVADDISDRGAFPRADPVAPPFAFDWIGHKSADASCPIGPGLVPAWLIADPQDLDIELRVNGQVMQSSSTSQMVIGIDALIAAASRLLTLEPGDVILTGTPAGVGAARGTFLGHGDVVTVTIEALGSIVHTIEEQR